MEKVSLNKDFPDYNGREETVVGVHQSGIQLKEGINTSTKRNYCSNCNRNIHCYVKVDKKTKEATIHKTCKNDDCECKCKTHYACKECGYLHPYDQIECNRKQEERISDPIADAAFDKFMKEWREEADKNNSEIKNKK